MSEYRSRYIWALGLAATILIGVAAGVAYYIGLSDGLARAGVEAATRPPDDWHRPWGAGVVLPLVFLGFWFLIIRGFCWGAPWYRSYGRLDEWHRRAHERMDGDTGSSAAPGRS